MILIRVVAHITWKCSSTKVAPEKHGMPTSVHDRWGKQETSEVTETIEPKH